MKKEMHPNTVKVHEAIKKMFKPGKELSYRAVGEKVGIAGETARKHAGVLAKKRLVSIKGGKISGVK